MPATFEQKVWEIVRAIPPGQVMTYGEVAQALGTRAYRAVGRACRNSPGMPDVPCHRVVNSRRLLHGFNGGLEKKRELLEGEGLLLCEKIVNGRRDYEVVERLPEAGR